MSIQLDLVLVAPGNRSLVYQGLGDTYSAIEPPVFAAMTAKYLTVRGVSVRIIDASAEGLTYQEVAERVDEMNPRLVGMFVYGYQPSSSTQNMPAARATCQAIKDVRPDLPIMITGTHPSALPERTLREEPVDLVVFGEWMISFHDAVLALKNNNHDWSNVSGICYWADGEKRLPMRTDSAPLIQNGDEAMPGIAWDLLPMSRYRAHNWHAGYGPVEVRMPYASIPTSLGCPFHCGFCCIQSPIKAAEQAAGMAIAKNSYRLCSPERVRDEFAFVAERYNVRYVKIPDEMFFLNPLHVKKIFELLARDFPGWFRIWAYTRVDTTKLELLPEAVAAGVDYFGVGIESANSKVRDGADKSFTDEKIYKVIQEIKAAGISIGGNFIFGLPEDTEESMKTTFQMALATKPELFNIYCAMAYPGSALYGQAKQKGIALPDDPGGPGWIGYSQHSYETFPLATDTVPAARVLELRDKAFNEYYTDPGVIAMLRAKFGEGAVNHINEMLKIPLRRKLLEREII